MLLAVFLALSPALSAAAPPSVEAAAGRFGPALVTVRWADEGASTGFFVTSAGTAVTVLPEGVTDVIVELAGGARRQGQVLLREADGLALVGLSLTAGETPRLPALAVVDEDRVVSAEVWLVGLGVQEGQPSPSLGGLRRVDARGRWRLDLPLPPGAPVLMDGRVVAVVLERDGRTASVALPAGRLRAAAARLPRP
ncbi:MAG: hypothetical protein HYS27_23300 [Deltaproteobacteria bacterium]|nr:hypothetical protein [Deltaproteobacteria bacterium]